MALKILDQSESVGPTYACVLNRIHTLSNEMQPQSTGPYFIQSAHANLGRIKLQSAIPQLDFKRPVRAAIGAAPNSPKIHSDRLVQEATIGMAHNVRERLVHCSCN